MYIHQEYPKRLYHATKDSVVVKDPGEHAALGDGWAETPAAFADRKQPEPTPADKPKSRRK